MTDPALEVAKGRTTSGNGTSGKVEPNRDSTSELTYASSDENRQGYLWVKLLVGLVLLVAAIGLGWLVLRAIEQQIAGSKAPARGGFAVPIVAAKSRVGEMNVYLTGLGTVTPLNTVSIHSRVDGQVMKVNFTEGAIVAKDQLLVQLDSRPFEVQREQAEGQLLKDQAQLKDAQRDLDRYKSAPGSFTQQQIDAQQATVDQSVGAVAVDNAAIDSAKLNIQYCNIAAPLSGKIGFRLIDEGNIVHAADTTPVAVITQLQPITVIFNLPEDNLPQVFRATAKNPNLLVDAYNRDATTKIASGTLAAINNQVDPATGTVQFKATFPNTDNSLFPSQFVNARLLVDVKQNAVIVPSSAVQRSPDSTFVYVVKPDDTVEMRKVSTGPSAADETIIADGLSGNEIVVTDGVDKLIGGAKITIQKMLPTPGASSPSHAGETDTQAPGASTKHHHHPDSSGAVQQ